MAADSVGRDRLSPRKTLPERLQEMTCQGPLGARLRRKRLCAAEIPWEVTGGPAGVDKGLFPWGWGPGPRGREGDGEGPWGAAGKETTDAVCRGFIERVLLFVVRNSRRNLRVLSGSKCFLGRFTHCSHLSLIFLVLCLRRKKARP